MPIWLEELSAIVLLLVAVFLVIARLPKLDLGHTPQFIRRRLRNWLPMGLIYAFLYMGRYNLTVSKDAFGALMDNEAFGLIFAAGTITYGASFLINGPLTDRIGGKRAILIGAAGTIVANMLMGLVTWAGYTQNLVVVFSVLYAANMYFQSFGAVAIVKVNAPWFHVRERGVFGAVFGILISLGIYFAYDWGKLILKALPIEWVFFIPSMVLVVMAAWVIAAVKDTPGEAGLVDFDTGSHVGKNDEGPALGAIAVFKMMLGNPTILTIAFIEFCSGFLRQAIMQWYRTFSKQVGATDSYIYEHWGMVLCCAGILGGVVAGVISDRVFQSRRGPVAAILYAVMLVGSLILIPLYDTPALGVLALVLSMAVIGVHGMLSGTASMDFGGKRNVGIAVGIIDGFVYAGTGVMSLTYAIILPNGEAAKVAANWWSWPVAMVPIALLGLVLSRRVWNAKPRSGNAPAAAVVPAPSTAQAASDQT